jgi:hypothetical protein
MTAPDEREAQRRRLQAAIEADQQRFEQVNGLPEAVTGIASSPDGAVTVEVGMGGGLRSVRLTRQALRYGAAGLARTVLEVAERATAKANQRAEFAFRNAFGPQAAHTLGELGLGYDPELAEEPDDGEQSPLRRWPT